MTCRFHLDLTRLVSLGRFPGRAKVFTLRDEARQGSPPGDLARLIVRAAEGEHRVRLVGLGTSSTAATPWIPLQQGEAELEVQWRKTSADDARLDLWVDGCGPDPLACATGWRVTGLDQPGLVATVRLGAVGGFVDLGGEVRFDDVACAGDAWVEPE
jgi:hypothetical protein